MKFFDWLFKRNDEEFVAELPLTVLNRWFLYDTGMGNENDLAPAIGLTKVSEEGDAKEREDSDIRVENIAFLLPFMDHISTLTAETVAETQRLAMVDDGVPQEQVFYELDIVKKVYKGIALSALVAGFSISNELNFIHPNPEVLVDDEDLGELPNEF